MTVMLLLLMLLRTCRVTTQNVVGSLIISPNKTQFFEYDRISVSCKHIGSGDWTVWRYTSNSLGSVFSQCGSRWGLRTSSGCELKASKQSDSGTYWCESRYGDSSNAVNVTVTGSGVILRGPANPVKEGDDVILFCETKDVSPRLASQFFKNTHLIRTVPEGHMIISNFSKSNRGNYTCRTGHGESPPLWLLMQDDWSSASLAVSPSSSQHFEYHNVNLSCGENGRVLGWNVVRATRASGEKLDPQRIKSDCGANWGSNTSFGCVVQTAKMSDSGIYWCESTTKQRSNSVNLNIHNTPVILISPIHPVKPGVNITLHCKAKEPTANFQASFYKDDSFIRMEPSGNMTIHHVSKIDEGLYRCHISSHGDSPSSWLFVRDPRGRFPLSADPALYVVRVIRHLVLVSPYCISTILMVSLYLCRPTGHNRPVSMTMSPSGEEDDRLEQMHDDVTADVTTEHHF